MPTEERVIIQRRPSHGYNNSVLDGLHDVLYNVSTIPFSSTSEFIASISNQAEPKSLQDLIDKWESKTKKKIVKLYPNIFNSFDDVPNDWDPFVSYNYNVAKVIRNIIKLSDEHKQQAVLNLMLWGLFDGNSCLTLRSFIAVLKSHAKDEDNVDAFDADEFVSVCLLCAYECTVTMTLYSSLNGIPLLYVSRNLRMVCKFITAFVRFSVKYKPTAQILIKCHPLQFFTASLVSDVESQKTVDDDKPPDAQQLMEVLQKEWKWNGDFDLYNQSPTLYFMQFQARWMQNPLLSELSIIKSLEKKEPSSIIPMLEHVVGQDERRSKDIWLNSSTLHSHDADLLPEDDLPSEYFDDENKPYATNEYVDDVALDDDDDESNEVSDDYVKALNDLHNNNPVFILENQLPIGVVTQQMRKNRKRRQRIHSDESDKSSVAASRPKKIPVPATGSKVPSVSATSGKNLQLVGDISSDPDSDSDGNENEKDSSKKLANDKKGSVSKNEIIKNSQNRNKTRNDDVSKKPVDDTKDIVTEESSKRITEENTKTQKRPDNAPVNANNRKEENLLDKETRVSTKTLDTPSQSTNTVLTLHILISLIESTRTMCCLCEVKKQGR
jgi:hypothetical protein